MQPYFNKMTATGYQEIETEIEALKADRRPKSNSYRKPAHLVTSLKTPSIVPPNGIFVD